MTFRASKSDNQRLGAIVTRTRAVIGNEGVGDGKNNGALEVTEMDGDPVQCALHSGRIGGATQLADQGA